MVIASRRDFIKTASAGGPFDAAVLRNNHQSITHLHLKDRKRNDGPNMPWDEGDTPVQPVLTVLKEKKYPICALVEYEYQGVATPIEKVKMHDIHAAGRLAAVNKG